MSKSQQITINQAIERVMAKVSGPIEVSTFIDKVLKIRPSSAKKPTTSIRNKLREEHEGISLIFLDKKTLVPLRVVAPGIRFRIPLSRQEIDQGILFVDPSFKGWMTYRDDPQTFELADEQGKLLPTKVVLTKPKVVGILEIFKSESNVFDLADWFRANNAHRNDSILVTIESWEPKRFKLELEPGKKYRRHHSEIAHKNQELADILFNMLENSTKENIRVIRSIPTAYLHLSDPRGYPGDHWIHVVEQDPRMKLNFFDITYAENRNMLETFLERDKPRVPKRKLTLQQKKQIYRFKAAFKFEPGVWRRIEIRAEQSLSDLDRILRRAFNHDTWDHLGGFWKLVRRGKGNRFREIDLGDVDPLGEGTGADVQIAGLNLQTGDKLRYVYDFGDWIEHEITLEAIDIPLTDVEYPRITDQNKPRYRYCEHCKDEGRKTVATYICFWCSEEEGRDVLVCEDCLNKYHEDHYADEIVY